MRQSRWRGWCSGGAGTMVVDPLQRRMGAVVVGAEHGGARHDADIGHGVEFGHRAGDPLGRRHAVDRAAVAKQAAAERENLRRKG